MPQEQKRNGEGGEGGGGERGGDDYDAWKK